MHSYSFRFTSKTRDTYSIITIDRPALTSHELKTITSELLWVVSLYKCDCYCECYRDCKLYGIIDANITDSGDGVDLSFNGIYYKTKGVVI